MSTSYIRHRTRGYASIPPCPRSPPRPPRSARSTSRSSILLTQSLVAGEWKPGEAIPSEIELAARFRVSQGTVRKAIDELAAEHILVRRQGKGTFVASHSEPSYQYRFLRVHARLGREAASAEPLLRSSKRGKAGGEVARALRLKAGARRS